MGANESRGRAAAGRLRAIATPRLYRRNPFRLTGLSATASRRTVREQRLRVLGVLDVGGSRPPGVPADATPEEIRTAFDALGNTEHRFVDELFWTWGTPDECGCPPQLHHKHDLAVAAHAAALEAELEVSEDHPAPLWDEAARSWATTLGNDAFWRHLAHRVDVLGDRRLDESTVDGIRGALPEALLAPLVALTAESTEPHRLVQYLPMFGGDKHTVADARSEAAEPTYARVEALLKDLRKLLDEGQARTAADRALESLAGPLDRLADLVPRAEFRRTASLTEMAAVSLNNIGVALADSSGSSVGVIRDVFALARRFTTDPDTIATVKRNEEAALGAQGTTKQRTTTPPYRPTSPVSAPIDVGQLWSAVTRLIKRGRYNEAIVVLNRIVEVASRAEDREQARRMIGQMRQLRDGGRPRRFFSGPRVLMALAHVAFAMTLLALFVAAPLGPALLIGVPGLFVTLGLARDPAAGHGRLPGLLVTDAVAGLVLWLIRAGGTPIPVWVPAVTVILLLLVGTAHVSSERTRQ
ncbi:hypothetical protein VSH64_30000 [Amycolatopsis rhabdoformis]|uniref:Tetratricopeptide repeat protein n=1 Tax=Amycolatopsis rhabdoformis TaxID=1448059 RepID=A0ABZ1HY80_9PSEU|nr:hypothetical protein [Amycolatopsis rhabdoformis]WSE27087.1 hypothetical protein VSH64_30000 [Amycolatopsis rhabdoformis]